MTITYLTGTRHPSAALKRFLPDYIDVLLHRGESLLTTNNPGVDRLIIRHCDQHNLPLQVCEFAADSRQLSRAIKVASDAVQVQRIVSPTWQRFRHLADKVDKIIFFHAAKTRGGCAGLTTRQAFEMACARRGVVGEQLIIQSQHAVWVSETELRNSPTIGAGHIYLNSRFLPDLNGGRHWVAHFRIETWRRIGEIVQPGQGRKEFVLPHLSREQALLHMLHHALLELDDNRPERLIIHHWSKHLERAAYRQNNAPSYPELRQQVRHLLDQYPQIIWCYEKQADVMKRIGQPILASQSLWHHKRKVAAYRGLYQ